MNTIPSIFLFFFGASIGSFLNAWAMRFSNESVLSPSGCRGCGKRLKFYELIPVFSYLIQLGKCGCKRTKISRLYFCAEFFLGIAFVIFFTVFPLVDALCLASFSSILLFCFLTDFYHRLLSLSVMLTGYLLGLIYDFYLHQTITKSLLGGVVGFLIMWLIAKSYFLFRKSHGMGDGDKYLMGFIGAWTGWVKVIGVLFISSWIGLLAALFLILKKRANLKTALPLGVFIVPAVPVTFYFFKYII